MRTIEAHSAEQYLRDSGRLEPHETISASMLAGGVSNVVIRCESNLRPAFILKQSRPQLRTADPWFCSPERIWREVATLQLCNRILCRPSMHASRAIVPELLFADHEHYAFAMTAAPEPHCTWKSSLLQGECSHDIAADCGTLLGTLHAETWHDSQVARQFDDRNFFDALRLDPYYRFAAEKDPEFRDDLLTLVESVWLQRHALVHGDFSPKNLLTFSEGCMLIDFEVGHYGDPAFDIGFFLTHLVLKAIHRLDDANAYLSLADHFWDRYAAVVQPRCDAITQVASTWNQLQARGLQNLAGCLIARVAGKSKIDYPVDAQAVRTIVRSLFRERPADWQAARPMIVDAVNRAKSRLP